VNPFVPFAFAVVAAAHLVAQQGIDPSAVPVEQEPRHHLVFSNDHVRVLDVLLPPLYVSQYHTHTFDSVAVTIVPGIDGPAGRARIGFAGFSRGGYSHVITNPNTAPMRLVAVELREADRPLPPAGDVFTQPNHAAVIDNGRVRVVRVTLEAGESIAEHRHAAGYASVTVRGGEGPGTWRWHPAGEAGATLAAGAQALELIEVEPK
jgi:hypothetical protein